MSKLLARLSRAEHLTMNEINDLEYMASKLETWLDNGLIDFKEHARLAIELSL